MLKSAIKINIKAKKLGNLLQTQSNLKSYLATNEPIFDYKRDSLERNNLKKCLDNFMSQGVVDVPIVIGDKEIRTSNVRYQVLPFDHKTKLAKFYYADKKLIQEAIQNSLTVRTKWESISIDERCNILLKAADILAGPKRADILASTMLGQGKTIFQAEIDAACELIDFLRFNVQFLYEALKYKPLDVGTHTRNNMQLRGLEGFVAAIAPFNFTAIGGNLCTAPALMGNVVLFKVIFCFLKNDNNIKVYVIKRLAFRYSCIIFLCFIQNFKRGWSTCWCN
jgi:1-pyrroline-5-carboxylate dehydrogenase